MRQVHLSTAVLLMFGASLLLALNMAGTTVNYYGKPAEIDPLTGRKTYSWACGTCDVRGFPLPASDGNFVLWGNCATDFLLALCALALLAATCEASIKDSNVKTQAE